MLGPAKKWQCLNQICQYKLLFYRILVLHFFLGIGLEFFIFCLLFELWCKIENAVYYWDGNIEDILFPIEWAFIVIISFILFIQQWYY